MALSPRSPRNWPNWPRRWRRTGVIAVLTARLAELAALVAHKRRDHFAHHATDLIGRAGGAQMAWTCLMGCRHVASACGQLAALFYALWRRPPRRRRSDPLVTPAAQD